VGTSRVAFVREALDLPSLAHGKARSETSSVQEKEKDKHVIVRMSQKWLFLILLLPGPASHSSLSHSDCPWRRYA